MATQLREHPVNWLRRLFRRRSTPSRPWTVTLAWVEGQNFGRISVMPRRTPVLAIFQLLTANERVIDVLAEYDLTPQQLEVLIRLRAELASHPEVLP